jgi:hypothetical protein
MAAEPNRRPIESAPAGVKQEDRMGSPQSRCIVAVAFLLVIAGAQPLPAQKTPIEPAKSFEDVPPLAKDSAEVRQQIAMIASPEGKKVVGDKRTEMVNQRYLRWTKDLVAETMAQGMNAGAMSPGNMGPDAANTVNLLQTTMITLSADTQKAVSTYGEAERQLSQQYDDAIAQIAGNPGDCHSKVAAYLKAGDTYLKNLATPYGTLKAKLKKVATDAQSVHDQADKAFSGHPPAFAEIFYRQLTSAALGALATANTTENDAVVKVYNASVVPGLECNNQPHL